MNYSEPFGQIYLFCFIIVLPFLISLIILFGSDDEDGINDNINKNETDKEVKLEKKENEITNINNNDLDVSNLFIFKNMKKLEIQNPDISIEIIEKEDKITKNINIKADEMNIEYQERK